MIFQHKLICLHIKNSEFFFTAECERQLEMVLGERSNAHDSLVKKENMTANLEAEKKKLEDNLQAVSKNTGCVTQSEQSQTEVYNFEIFARELFYRTVYFIKIVFNELEIFIFSTKMSRFVCQLFVLVGYCTTYNCSSENFTIVYNNIKN